MPVSHLSHRRMAPPLSVLRSLSYCPYAILIAERTLCSADANSAPATTGLVNHVPTRQMIVANTMNNRIIVNV